ncbi:MAG: NAD(P) transhydrogenase subunit alpha [Candidatus Eisenbacteria bacterium]|uniref:proton-translocating NAD(P)(+) transhydrogenase n=1 Tax=Eiseniibacteriota bacterium TaxID=2212470 RepID=A0A849SQR2_UNCEI|nr:NAD(P) transhydrogenase subunit alpha [Candidatus Eisenbacteria bacterium]
MNPELLAQLTVFVLAVFLGFEVISKVPVVLHTPLMSGTNAIHGIVVIGGILVLGHANSALEGILGFVAVLFGAMNLAGGFVVTDRMLEMFKKKAPEKRS